MKSLNKTQKAIIIAISSFIILIACYYIYSKDENYEEFQTNIENTEKAKNKKEATEENIRSKETNIIVHISGAVNKEGIIELEENSRISNAIEKAGGLKEDAYIKDINLAYKLEDGMKIYIPTNKEIEEKNKQENREKNSIKENEEYIKKDSGIESIKKESETENDKNTFSSSIATKININKATQTELETLPGIGPSMALKIIEYRKEKGSFSEIEEIKEVNGIGEVKFNKIRDLISI